MKSFKKFALLSALAVLGFSATAQSDNNIATHTISVVVPNVALLDIESSISKDFTSTFVQNAEAGEKITVPTSNTDLWLNYSSILSASATASTGRKILVKANVLVPGLDIAVTAGAATATGAGTKGTPTAAVTLTTSDQSLITGIGSVYTESGPSKGHQLTYSFTALDANYANLRSKATTVTVTYTLEDN